MPVEDQYLHIHPMNEEERKGWLEEVVQLVAMHEIVVCP